MNWGYCNCLGWTLEDLGFVENRGDHFYRYGKKKKWPSRVTAIKLGNGCSQVEVPQKEYAMERAGPAVVMLCNYKEITVDCVKQPAQTFENILFRVHSRRSRNGGSKVKHNQRYGMNRIAKSLKPSLKTDEECAMSDPVEG